ncbi:MAG: phenylalanine--tRNA ligase subunit beta, partial [Micropruina sp.]
MSWLRDYVDLPPTMGGRELGEVFIRAGLEVETVEAAGGGVGPLVVGRVLDYVDEPQKNGKVIRWCHLDVGAELNDPAMLSDAGLPSRGVVCGAHNFAAGDLVVVGLPGTVLAGGFTLSARKTYGHVSDGMICAEDELGIGEDHSGIIVLPTTAGLAPGDDPSDYLNLHDDVLDINVSPDMSYCLSIRGLAREAAQALDVRFTDIVTLATPGSLTDGYPIRLDDPACPLFVALTVTGIDQSRPTPPWMQRRLSRAGMRSISLPVDISNYVMLETGQPNHTYDADLLSGPIVVRKAADGETCTTLDGQVRTLSTDDLLITDDSGPIGIAGVMGGASTEIRDTSTSVLIEGASFDAATISRSMRRHGLPSEASKRFERGVDPNAAYSAARLVARYLVELAGGTLSEAQTVAGALPEVPSQRIAVDLPSRILGIEVPLEPVVRILTASGVAVEVDDAATTLTLTPPSWRPDLRDPYDYVEEVGRKIGFDQIPSVVPQAPQGRGLTAGQRARRAINAALVGAGFVEVLVFPFASVEDLDRLGVDATDPRRELVRVANPLADTQPYLRSTMLPGLFAAVQRNVSRGNDDLAFFETGRVFRGLPSTPAPVLSVLGRPSADELAALDAALPSQPRHLAAVLSGSWRPTDWRGAGEPAGWQHAVALADL